MAALGYDVDPVPNRDELRALLGRHRAADGDEQGHRRRMLALLDVPGDPFVRGHFTPGHFTASGFVVSPDGDALLLIRHPKLGRWLQPGGHVEASDADLPSAARREVLEEVGLADLPLGSEGAFDLDVHRIPPLGSEPAHEHFDVRFLFRAHDRELGALAETDAEGTRWFTLTELDGPDTDASVRRAARKLRR
jgi:ADP-ribose pyrophosphatase YjhB (NUDIX family)